MSRYDQKSINAILKTIRERNWGRTHYLCEEYIKSYPNDIYIYLVYINVLLKLGRTEKARELYNQVKLAKKEHKNNINTHFYATVKLLLQEEKYQECLDFLNDHKNLFTVKEDSNYVRTFCKSMLGKPIIDIGYDGYIYNQIINYREEDAIEHIREHANKDNKDAKGFFSPDIDIEECFHIIRSRIPHSLKLYVGVMYYDSIFKIEDCGTYDGEKTDLVVATGIVNTDKILTIYPNRNINKQAFIDITHDLKR